MTDTEFITDPATGGIKGRKAARFELLPGDALAAVAVHFAKGSRKYEDRNWERGYDWSLNFGAMQRHLWAWWQGEDIDGESGSSHMVSAAWHALALVAFELRAVGTDDRPKPKPKRKRRKDAGIPRVEVEMSRCTYPDCRCIDPSSGCELRAPLELPWVDTADARAATAALIEQRA